jgi:hypothetical protein
MLLTAPTMLAAVNRIPTPEARNPVLASAAAFSPSSLPSTPSPTCDPSGVSDAKNGAASGTRPA